AGMQSCHKMSGGHSQDWRCSSAPQALVQSPARLRREGEPWLRESPGLGTPPGKLQVPTISLWVLNVNPILGTGPSNLYVDSLGIPMAEFRKYQNKTDAIEQAHTSPVPITFHGGSRETHHDA
ncbi:hypothetical protein H1C71_005884, partial [Ictidomys tridecemlineatus]